MLAPLKDRSIIEGPAEPTSSTTPQCGTKSEIEDLRRALRESRDRLRRGAWESTKQISHLNAEVTRLQAICSNYEVQLECYASGVAIVELGQALMRLTDNNERLLNSAHRVWLLEKNIDAAHSECQKLATERDTLAQQLHQTKLEQLSGQVGGGV